MQDGDRADSRSFQKSEAPAEAKEKLLVVVVNVELEKVMRKLPVVEGMPGIDPLAKQDKAILQTLLDGVPLHRRLLLEQVVLRMHSLRDEMAATLEDHLAVGREVNADVRPVDFSSTISESSARNARESRSLALIIVRAARAEQMRRAGVLDEIIS